MKKKRKWKRITAGIIAATVVVSSGVWPEASAEAETDTVTGAAFNEENIVLKIGVLSDLHLLQTDDGIAAAQTRVQNYANAVATLDELSGNDLDMLMLAGDYTNEGTEKQATMFASATKAILDAINTKPNKTEDNKTQLVMTYGNHDTCWTGCMDVAGWENVLNSYGLLDNATISEKASGCYKVTVERGGKTYAFFSIETVAYNSPSNMFYQSGLDWLDAELKETTTENPNTYTYVVSHAPIAESGVYGVDMAFEKNADWATANAGSTGTTADGFATSSDIDGVLAKYPQVVYFSGHTHLTNVLESTIMQDDYTAITVSGFNRGDLYSTETDYLDGAAHLTGVNSNAYGLYIAVDANGNQRVERVELTSGNMVSTTVTYSSDYVVKSVEVADADMTIKTLDKAWTMAAPNGDKEHLNAYTSDRGVAPVFSDGASVTVENLTIDANRTNVSFDFTFDTASCSNKIIRYELHLINQQGKVVDNQWILGNWTNHTTGIVDEGETHLNATKLKYSVAYSSEQLSGCTELTALIYAVDEFGAKSEPISSSTQKLGILKPSASGANYNMFDGFTADRIIVASALNNAARDYLLTTETDQTGKMSVTVDTVTAHANGGQKHEEIAYALDKDRYDYMNALGESIKTSWNNTATNAKKYTELDIEDTFVYEADYSIDALGNGVYITFRTTDALTYQTDYTGFFINYTQCRLYINGVIAAASTAFKYTGDNRATSNTWHLTIVSSPEKVSMWINDTIVFDNVDYTVKDYATENTGSDSATYPYLQENAKNSSTVQLKSTDMIPVIGQYIEGGAGSKYTLSNQMLYLYNTDEQVGELVGADERNYYDASKITTNNTANSISKTVNLIAIDATYNTTNVADRIYANLNSDDFSSDDTVVMEFDYTPTQLDTTGDRREIQINFRKGSKKMGLLVRDNLTMLQIDETVTGTEIFSGETESLLKIKQTLCFKVISEPTKATIYINGVAIAECSYGDATDMMPYLEIYVRNGCYTFENISIRKEGGTLENVTSLATAGNLISGEYGEIISNVMAGSSAGVTNSVVNNKTNFYTDYTYLNLDEKVAEGYSVNYYGTENFYFFGKNSSGNNINYRMKPGESYVMSSIVRVSNGNLTKEETTYQSRVNVEVATYDGVEAWYYIEGTSLYVRNIGGSTSAYEKIDLASEIGYQVGDYIRLTTVVSPYGYDVYINGLKICSYEPASNTYVDYSVAYIGGKGAEVRFLDTALWYNTANGELYKEELLKDVRIYETLSGVYIEDKKTADATVAAIKEACNALSDNSNETLQAYVSVVDKLIATGKVVNNMIYAGSATIGNSFDVDMEPGQYNWAYNTYPIFEGDYPFENGEAWILEADVACLSNFGSTRVGISFQKTGGADVSVIGNTLYITNTASSDNLIKYKDGTVTGPTWKTGQEWHVKFIVKSGVSVSILITSIADGSELYKQTIGWSEIRASITDTLVPCLYLACGDYEVTNVYVGYDLTDDVSALNTAIEETGSDIDTVDYTLASIKAYEEALAAATTVSEMIEMYTKQEINDATTTLTSALKKPQEYLTVGNGEYNHSITFGVADGEVLPIGEYLEETVTVDAQNVNVKHYIIGWTVEGEPVTEYDEDIKADAYTPNFIDTKMLDVKIQSKQETDGTYTAKLIGSVDNYKRKEYVEAGFVLSTKNPDPLLADNAKVVSGITTVYQYIWADGEKLAVEDIFDNYSNYLFAMKATKLPESVKTIYVRAFIKLQDGTIVYGEPCAKTVTTE